MDNFNFRNLGLRDSQKFAANRLLQYTSNLRFIYDEEAVDKCNKVLRSCVALSNGKINHNKLKKIHNDFAAEFLPKGSIPSIRCKKPTTADITRTYLLLLAIDECSRCNFCVRITLGYINGLAALSGFWSVESERIAQVRAYNRYMQKRRRKTIQIQQAQQPNVLYPNRQISLGEEE